MNFFEPKFRIISITWPSGTSIYKIQVKWYRSFWLWSYNYSNNEFDLNENTEFFHLDRALSVFGKIQRKIQKDNFKLKITIIDTTK